MPHTITLFGIPNCDTVKKSRQWFSDHGVDIVFHDYKKQGVPTDALTHWVAMLGWDPLINRKGTTWRQLPADTQATVVNATSAVELMQQHPSVIKRPVVVCGSTVTVGFAPDQWQKLAS